MILIQALILAILNWLIYSSFDWVSLSLNQSQEQFQKNQEPARTTIEVSGLPLGVNVEIDMIAIKVEVKD